MWGMKPPGHKHSTVREETSRLSTGIVWHFALMCCYTSRLTNVTYFHLRCGWQWSRCFFHNGPGDIHFHTARGSTRTVVWATGSQCVFGAFTSSTDEAMQDACWCQVWTGPQLFRNKNCPHFCWLIILRIWNMFSCPLVSIVAVSCILQSASRPRSSAAVTLFWPFFICYEHCLQDCFANNHCMKGKQVSYLQ